jgi:hypothetical protein
MYRWMALSQGGCVEALLPPATWAGRTVVAVAFSSVVSGEGPQALGIDPQPVLDQAMFYPTSVLFAFGDTA